MSANYLFLPKRGTKCVCKYTQSAHPFVFSLDFLDHLSITIGSVCSGLWASQGLEIKMIGKWDKVACWKVDCP